MSRNIARLEIAASGAEQSGHMPVIEHGHVRAAEITTEKRRGRIVGPGAGQRHEARCMVRAAANGQRPDVVAPPGFDPASVTFEA